MERRRARRERHERHKRERAGEIPRSERSEHKHRKRHDRERERDRDSHSESDNSSDGDDDDRVRDDERPQMLEGSAARRTEPVMSGGLGPGGEGMDHMTGGALGGLRENPDVPGQYLGYVRNPPPVGGLK